MLAKYVPLTLILATGLIGNVAAAPGPEQRTRVERPDVPANLEVDEAYRPYLLASADGTQNYICLASGTGVAWTFLGPQATLFDGELDQVMAHYFSPNPQEAGTARATWRHSRDTSTVWAVAGETSSDPAYVAPGAIPWLELRVTGAQCGGTYAEGRCGCSRRCISPRSGSEPVSHPFASS